MGRLLGRSLPDEDRRPDFARRITPVIRQQPPSVRATVPRRKQVYKIIYPNGMIYVARMNGCVDSPDNVGAVNYPLSASHPRDAVADRSGPCDSSGYLLPLLMTKVGGQRP